MANVGGKDLCAALQDHGAPAREEAGERRSSDRHASDFNAACVLGAVDYVVELRDLSARGAKVCIREGIVPRPGQEVMLRLLDGQSIKALVVWEADDEVGLEFRETIADFEDKLHFDDMGAELFRSILKMQKIGK